MRRRPAQRAELQHAVRICQFPHVDGLVGDPEIIAEAVHHALRCRRGARREAEHAEIVRPRARVGRVVAVTVSGQQLEQSAIGGRAAIRIAIAERYPVTCLIAPRRVGVQVPVIQHQLRVDTGEHLARIGGVYLHIDGAERRAVALDCEVQHRHFQPVVGQHRDAPAGADAAFRHEPRHPAGQLPQLAERDRPAVLVDGDDERLVAARLRVAAQHVRDAAIPACIRRCGNGAGSHGGILRV